MYISDQTSYEIRKNLQRTRYGFQLWLWKNKTKKQYHFPEVDRHFSAILKNSPDEQSYPGSHTALLPVHTLSQQQLIHMLKGRDRNYDHNIVIYNVSDHKSNHFTNPNTSEKTWLVPSLLSLRPICVLLQEERSKMADRHLPWFLITPAKPERWRKKSSWRCYLSEDIIIIPCSIVFRWSAWFLISCVRNAVKSGKPLNNN